MVLCEKSNTFNVFHLTLSAKMASFKSLFSVLYKNPPIKKSRNSPVFSEKRSQDGKVRPGIGISSYSTSGQILYQRENRLPTSLGTALSTRAAVADFSPPQILTHFGKSRGQFAMRFVPGAAAIVYELEFLWNWFCFFKWHLGHVRQCEFGYSHPAVIQRSYHRQFLRRCRFVRLQ